MKVKKVNFRVFFILLIVTGLVVVASIVRMPSEQSGAQFLGLSFSRLLLLVFVLVLIIMAGAFLVASWREDTWFNKQSARLDVAVSNPKTFVVLVGIAGLIAFACAQYALYTFDAGEPVIRAYLLRLQPVLIWMALLGTLTVLLLFFWRFYPEGFSPIAKKNIFLVAGIFLGFLLLWGWLAKTGYGFSRESQEFGIFHLTGAPILGVQILLSLGMVILLYWSWRKLVQRNSFFNSDLFFAVVIWVLTFIVWIAVPLDAGWFVEAPYPPNHAYYPNSDASYYDTVAHSLLVGEGFASGGFNSPDGPIARKPMFDLFVALLHAVGGVGYENVIPLQVAVLALFPVVIYFLTKSIHSRAAGLMTALLIMFRERNAIALSDHITVTHAKAILSDLPATLGVVLFLLIMMWWLQQPKKRLNFALLAGGLIAAFILVRPDLGAMIPFVGLGALLTLRRRPALWGKGMLLVGLGVILVLAPWVIRNWCVTGKVFLDIPGDRLGVFRETIFRRETGFSPLQDEEMRTKVNGKALLDPNPPDPSPPLTTKDIVFNHYFNGQAQSLLYLPIASNLLVAPLTAVTSASPGQAFVQMCCSSPKYVRSLPYWWSDWNGRLATQSLLPLTLILFLIALGLASTWRRRRTKGLLPLFAYVAHLFIYALFRRSGGRFILEVDWITAMFYGIGLVELIFGTWSWLRRESLDDWLVSKPFVKTTRDWNTPKAYLLIGLFVFFIGVTPPLVEMIIPQRYSQAWFQTRYQALLESESLDVLGTEKKFSNQQNVFYGRALYPRYFAPGKGMTGWTGAFRRDISRIEFYLVGSTHAWVALPYNSVLEEFPHASDVIFVGEDKEFFIEADVLFLYQGQSPLPVNILGEE
jgi:hypothetical protein